MPTFHYVSVSRAGQPGAGTIEAGDRSEVVRLLQQRGEIATRVETLGKAAAAGFEQLDADGVSSSSASSAAVATAAGAPRSAARGAATERMKVGTTRSMSRGELAGFIREIATALEAGLPLMNALRAVERQATSARQRAVLLHLIHRIEGGRSLAQAAGEWGAPFDDMIVGMIRAGELSGRLDTVMLQLADLLDRDADVRRSVAQALVYPAILIVALGIGIAVIVGVIIPQILTAMDNVAMPLPTRIVQGVAQFISTYWIALVVVAVVAVVGWAWAMKKETFKYRVHRALLRTPVVGTVVRDVAVGRFTRTLGTLLSSGIQVLDGLIITRDTLGNRAMERVIDEVAEKVRSGKSIAEPMEQSGYFPPLLIQIISLGERSGRLDQMLTQAADSFDRKTQASIKLFMTILPPFIIIFMATIVAFVLVAVFLPLLEMQSAIG